MLEYLLNTREHTPRDPAKEQVTYCELGGLRGLAVQATYQVRPPPAKTKRII